MFSSIAAAPASCIARAYSVQPSGRDAVEARDHGDVDGRGGALQQAQIAARAVVLLGHGREVGQRLGEALGCRRRPAGRPARPPPAAAPRTARTARPRRRRRPPAAGRRRRCATAARRTPRAGCAARGPCSWSRAPSVVIPPGVGREVARRCGWPSPRRSASAGRPSAARGRAGARPRPGWTWPAPGSAALPCGSRPAGIRGLGESSRNGLPPPARTTGS